MPIRAARERGAEYTALAGNAPDADPAALRLDNPFREGKPQSGSPLSGVPRGIDLFKFIEEAAKMLRRYSNARVFHLKAEPSRRSGLHAYPHGSPLVRKLQSIGEIVEE